MRMIKKRKQDKQDRKRQDRQDSENMLMHPAYPAYLVFSFFIKCIKPIMQYHVFCCWKARFKVKNYALFSAGFSQEKVAHGVNL